MATLHEKILDIMGEVRYLAKDDKVEFNNTRYKALSEEKVTSIMRSQMVKHRLVVYPIRQEWMRIGQISHVDVTYRIMNVDDTSDWIDVVSCGDGADTQDKGAGKAMTYAYKYMWLRTFGIPTGEDPDKISSEELDSKQDAGDALISANEQEILKKVCESKGFDPALVFPNGLNLTAAQYTEALQRLDKIKKGQ
jgi:hypothetical protein